MLEARLSSGSGSLSLAGISALCSHSSHAITSPVPGTASAPPAQRGSPGSCSPTMQQESDCRREALRLTKHKDWKEGWGLPGFPPFPIPGQTKGIFTDIPARGFCTSPMKLTDRRSIYLLLLSKTQSKPNIKQTNFTKKAEYLQ